MIGVHEDMDTNTLLTYHTAVSFLRPARPSIFTSAEEKRSWSRKWTPALRDVNGGSVLDRLWDSTLMRTYDAMSGSYPDDDDHRMLARDARMRLDEEETRRETLTKHANHAIWGDTPYISFTNSPQSLQELADWRRTRNRGDQKIVAVDPRIRLELGLPVLRYSEEIAHYRIETPYAHEYWCDHYLCLWEVTPEEVVGVWDWDDLRCEPNWYKEFVMPAVDQHRQNRDRDKFEEAMHQRDDYVGRDSSDVSDDTDDDIYRSDSDDSYERVYNENSTGEIMKMYEDLGLD